MIDRVALGAIRVRADAEGISRTWVKVAQPNVWRVMRFDVEAEKYAGFFRESAESEQQRKVVVEHHQKRSEDGCQVIAGELMPAEKELYCEKCCVWVLRGLKNTERVLCEDCSSDLVRKASSWVMPVPSTSAEERLLADIMEPPEVVRGDDPAGRHVGGRPRVPLFSGDGAKRASAIVGLVLWMAGCWGYNVLVQM